jgi:predicted negative regulator of RcsB-dependent stress response
MLPEAIAEYEAVLQKIPDYAGARFSFAEVLRRAGKPADALSQFKEILNRKPANSAALESAGDVSVELNRRSDAREFYRTALENVKTRQARKALRQKLNSISRTESIVE